MKTNTKAGRGFVLRVAALFLAVLLAGCAPAEQATQTESPEVKRYYRMDERVKGSFFPLYVRSGKKLIGLYYAYGKPTSREFCDDFTFYYGAEEYSVFRHFESGEDGDEELYFAGDYTVSGGEVFCTLYHYVGGELTDAQPNVLASSVAFSRKSRAVAYIVKQNGMYCLRYKNGRDSRQIDENVSQVMILGEGAVYLRNDGDKKSGIVMYWNGSGVPMRIGTAERLLWTDESRGMAATLYAEGNMPFGKPDIQMFFPEKGTKYVLYDASRDSKDYWYGFTVAGNKLLYLTDSAVLPVDRAEGFVPVQGSAEVLFRGEDGVYAAMAGESWQDKNIIAQKVTLSRLDTDNLPARAWRIRGWFYSQNASTVTGPDGERHDVRYICCADSNLYALISSGNGVTGYVKNISNGAEPLGAAGLMYLLNPIYVGYGSLAAYFYREGKHVLVFEGEPVLYGADASREVRISGADMHEIAAYTEKGDLVFIRNGETLWTVPEGVILG